MWIMIAGPYRQNSDNPEVWETNLKRLNSIAYQVFLRGHIPMIGVNLALPIIQSAGMDEYQNLMLPISLALSERCDAVLRIDGESSGADAEVRLFEEKGLPVYYEIDQLPAAAKHN
ncbi:MAG: DUF4406 domain-containing protein [Bacteroidota bacterium]